MDRAAKYVRLIRFASSPLEPSPREPIESQKRCSFLLVGTPQYLTHAFRFPLSPTRHVDALERHSPKRHGWPTGHSDIHMGGHWAPWVDIGQRWHSRTPERDGVLERSLK
jgi:hypothetical protein